MNAYNPHNPTVAGSEWYPSASRTKQPSAGLAAGTIIHSTVTETVSGIYPYAATAGTPGGYAICDIYDLAAMPANWPAVDTISRRYVHPAANSTAGVVGGGTWNKDISGVLTAYDANGWQLLDDGVSDADATTVGNADGIQDNLVNNNGAQLSYAGGTSFFDGATGVATSDLTGLRIAGLEIVLTYLQRSSVPAAIAGFLRVDGIEYDGTPIVAPVGGGYRRASFMFPVDPRTKLPWTNAAATTFLGVATNFFGFLLTGRAGTTNPIGGGPGLLLVTALGLMFHTLPERRTATALSTISGSSAWLSLPVCSPADDTPTTWAKTAGRDYLLLFRPTADVSGLLLAAVDTSATAGHETDPALTPGQDVATDPTGVPLSLQAPDGTNLAVLLAVPPGNSVDSQPYASTRTDLVGGTANTKLEQPITNVGTGIYGTATVLVQTTPGAAGQAAQDVPLTITLRQPATNIVLAGPFTLPAADVPPDSKWHAVAIRFDTGVALTSGQGCYLEVSATGGTVPWQVSALLTRTPALLATDTVAVLAGNVGISGPAGSGAINLVADATLDYPWNVGTVPSPPTGLAAIASQIANAQVTTGPAAMPTIGFAAVTWNPTVLGAAFGFYELQRQEADGNYYPIWNVTSETATYFNDFETPRATAQVLYRMRVVRSDGQPSSFITATGPGIVTFAPCDVILASNFTPSLSVAFPDETPYQFTRAETARTVIQAIDGRTNPVQFQPSGDGQGDIFTRSIIVAINDPSVVGLTSGRVVFDPLIARINDPTSPYVAMADGRGRRWFCGLTFGGGSETEPQGDYSAKVVFNEVATVPTPGTGVPPTVIPVGPVIYGTGLFDDGLFDEGNFDE